MVKVCLKSSFLLFGEQQVAEQGWMLPNIRGAGRYRKAQDLKYTFECQSYASKSWNHMNG